MDSYTYIEMNYINNFLKFYWMVLLYCLYIILFFLLYFSRGNNLGRRMEEVKASS